MSFTKITLVSSLLALSLIITPAPVAAQGTLTDLLNLLDRLNQQRQKLEYLIASLGSSIPVAQAATSLVTSANQCPSTSPALMPGAGGKNAPTYIVSQVTRIQQYLITRGYLAPGNDTGYFGTATAAAITQFQRAQKAYGLSTSGVADKNTLKVMRDECLVYVTNLNTKITSSPAATTSTTQTTSPTNSGTTPSANISTNTSAVPTTGTSITSTPVPTTGVIPVNETPVWNQDGVLLSGYNIYQPQIFHDTSDAAYPYKMWFFGWASSICNKNISGLGAKACDAIFYAVSSDGNSWRVYTGDVNGVPQFVSGSPERWRPIISAGTSAYDDTHAGDPSVVKVGNTYFMAYSMSGSDADGKWPSEVGDRDGFLEVIGGAVSTDGVHWTKRATPLLSYPNSLGAPDPAVGGAYARPSLLYDDGTFKLWFDYIGPSGTSDMGYASMSGGADTQTFLNGSFALVRGGSNPAKSNWPNPSVIKIGSQYFLYGDPVTTMPIGDTAEARAWTGRVMAEAVSNNGLNWTLRGYVEAPQGCAAAHTPGPLVDGDKLYVAFGCQKGGNPYSGDYYQIRRMYRPLNATLPAPTPPTTILKVNGSTGPVSINSGQSISVEWSVSNAIACSVEERQGNNILEKIDIYSYNGKWLRKPAQSVSYFLTCVSLPYLAAYNPAYASDRTIEVTVTGSQNTPPPPTVTLSTSANSITAGQPVVVTWSSQNANVCALLETVSGQQQSGLSGSWTRTPSATTNYNLQCYNSAWQGVGDTINIVSAVRSVTVASVPTPSPPPATPAPTATLTVNDRADAVTITAGESVNINWSSQNAAACSLSALTTAGQSVLQNALSGTFTHTPSQATTYALQCYNPKWNGSVSDTQNYISRTMLVTVNPAPVKCSATPDAVVLASNSSNFSVTVNNAGTASSMAVGVWSQAGDQDDIRWYYGTALGGGTWAVNVDPRNHPTTASEQTVYAAAYLNPGANPTFCDYASYTKPPN